MSFTQTDNCNRQQKPTKELQNTKINNSYTAWSEVLLRTPQGSIVGPILSNIALGDLFLIIKDVNFNRYADDNSIYDSTKSIDSIIVSLQESVKIIFHWFSFNQMKRNTHKCYLIMSTDKHVQILSDVSSIKINSCEKLLIVNIHSKLNFEGHVKTISSKDSNKLGVLVTSAPYMGIEK